MVRVRAVTKMAQAMHLRVRDVAEVARLTAVSIDSSILSPLGAGHVA
jgi:hypothetical protein